MLTQDEIKHLHDDYCRLSGLTVPLTMQRIMAWEQWGVHNFTKEDLRLVIKALQAKIFQHRKTITCLKFSTLIQNTEWFSEDLAEAKALNRVRRPDPERQKVLAATCRVVDKPNENPTMTAAQIMEQHSAMAKLLHDFNTTL